MTRQRLKLTLCVALASTAMGTLAQTPVQQLSSAPFTIVAPFPAGGAVDILSRILANGLTEKYKQSAVVENKPGAHGNIGIEQVKRAKPDGHTLLVVPQGNLTINPTLLPNIPYQVAQDFVPVASMARAANVLAVNPSVNAKSVKELVALSKSQPNSISYASPGVGSSLHMAGELFKETSGADILHIAYKGSNQGLNDALGKVIPMIIANMPTVLPHIKSGKLHALAITDPERSAFLPDVPTLKELGYPEVAISSWYGVLAPAGTSAKVVEQLAEDIGDILKSDAVQKQLHAQGMSPWLVKTQTFGKLIAQETQMWAPIVKKYQIASH